MDEPMPQKFANLPENWFPITPVSVKWKLGYGQEQRFIQRYGFPVVPNFSSTIHGATGRTLKSAIADLGTVKEMPSFEKAMKGYIALSRVRAAHHLLLARPFSPLLFRLGPHPFPTLLLQVLQGQLLLDTKALATKCIDERAHVENKERRMLKHCKWECGTCCGDKISKDYADLDVIYEHVIAPGALRICRLCSEMETCQQCDKALTRTSYSESRWMNRKRQNVVCIQCESNESVKCQKCLTTCVGSGSSRTKWKEHILSLGPTKKSSSTMGRKTQVNPSK